MIPKNSGFLTNNKENISVIDKDDQGNTYKGSSH